MRDSFTEDLLPLFRRALNTVALEGVRKHLFPKRRRSRWQALTPEGAGLGRKDPNFSSALAVYTARRFPSLICLFPSKMGTGPCRIELL